MTSEHTISPLPRSAPEAQGVASAALLPFVEDVEESLLELHSLILLRHGHVVAEGWWSPYGPHYPHMLYSLSKSFTATAAGLTIAEGRLSLDDPVLSFFPDEAPAQVSQNLAAMRIRHLLSMSTGHDQDTLGALFAREDGNWARAFLEQPVEHKPGTHFLYNSGATYMVSAIVQQVTGMRVLDYLQPRLFAPLGIVGATWETCPRGINTGGWGLSVKTEDIARFGQLYLQQGIWEGQRLLPAEWVKEATSRQIANGDDANSDWNQGYGYQFWRARHGAYRGDGAFGQFCVVMPEQDAVLAITAGVRDMQAVLNVVWKHLLPALEESTPLPEDTAAQETLRRRLANLTLRAPQGQPSSPVAARVSGQTYRFEANEQKIESVTLDFGADESELRIRDGRGEHRIACGSNGAWPRGTTAFDSPQPRPVAASGAWAEEDAYVVKLCFYETPFCPTLTCRFVEDRSVLAPAPSPRPGSALSGSRLRLAIPKNRGGDQLLLDYSANVSFGPTERPQLVGFKR
ncbi:MAG TPA: serine hydrolase [Chthonomonadaceae bacterium]|nr:serine hydrolase [Chthonomonadaceae bacterium]